MIQRSEGWGTEESGTRGGAVDTSDQPRIEGRRICGRRGSRGPQARLCGPVWMKAQQRREHQQKPPAIGLHTNTAHSPTLIHTRTVRGHTKYIIKYKISIISTHPVQKRPAAPEDVFGPGAERAALFVRIERYGYGSPTKIERGEFIRSGSKRGVRDRASVRAHATEALRSVTGW